MISRKHLLLSDGSLNYFKYFFVKKHYIALKTLLKTDFFFFSVILKNSSL